MSRTTRAKSNAQPPDKSLSQPESRINPYAPSGVASADPLLTEDQGPTETDGKPTLTLLQTARRWLIVCVLSAIPSFFFGLAITDSQVLAMSLGILIFVVLYTFLDYRTASWQWRQKRTVIRTLRIAYGTRITISILFPLGAQLDVICGMFSVGLVQSIMGSGGSPIDNPLTFTTSLVTTLVQGVLMNLVLAVYAVVIHLIQLLILTIRR